SWIRILEIVILSYFAAINLVYGTFTVIAFLDLIRYRRQIGGRRSRTMLSETTYRPISVLVPAFNEQETIVTNVQSLLMVGYPEFEVIVINDGSDDATLEVLRRAFSLVPSPSATRLQVSTKAVTRLYRSLEHSNLIVLDKERGGKSDSLNAGINASSYPLFCSLDADSLLDSDSLLRISRAFAEDDRIVAAGGIVRVLNEAEVVEGRVVNNRAPNRLIHLCQSQEYVRGFLIGRAALARLNALLIIAGAFGLFRKDAVIELGGYSTETVCEDLDLVVRLHRYGRENDRKTRVIFVPDPVCWTQVPSDWRSLINQRDRWQRGLLESLWSNRKMLFRRRYGAIGWVAMPYYILFEALGPLVETLGYAFVVALFLFGTLHLDFFVLFAVLSILVGILLSIAALNLDDLLIKRYSRASDVLKMMMASVVEFVGFRQLLLFVRLRSFVTVFYQRQWGSTERQEIPSVAIAPRKGAGAAKLVPERNSLVPALLVALLAAVAVASLFFLQWEWLPGSRTRQAPAAQIGAAPQVASSPSASASTPSAELVEPSARPAPPSTDVVRASPFDLVEGISWVDDAEQTTLFLATNGSIQPGSFEYLDLRSEPPRGVVKLIGIAAPFHPSTISMLTNHVLRVRFGFHPEHSPSALHIVADLRDARVGIESVEVQGQTLV
ncbi:MAG: glycosyltransferase family 2 protein, partial [Myxococcota bacterium]